MTDYMFDITVKVVNADSEEQAAGRIHSIASQIDELSVFKIVSVSEGEES